MNNEYLQKFAKNLKELRKQNEIKQDDFLNIDGISRSTIAMVETAKNWYYFIKSIYMMPIIG